MQRRIFVWFGASILLSMLAGAAMIGLVSPEQHSWREQVTKVQGFVGNRYAEAWDRPEARAALTQELATDFRLNITVLDAGGAVVEQAGGECRRVEWRAAIEREGRRLGEYRACVVHSHAQGVGAFLLGLLAVGLVLWAAAGGIARRLTRPLEQLVRVTRDIGDGKLSSRIRLNRHAPGEVGVLAETVNDMAARIEKQLADQRELLAAVSHELRTPLGHIRVLLDMGRDASADAGVAKLLDELEREVLEVDGLVDQLLASSRLEFDSLDRRALKPAAVVTRAVERADLDPAILDVEGGDLEFQGDATLLLRALANLLHNAREHGGGAIALRVRAGENEVRFEVDDAGPGFAEGEDLGGAGVFSPFYRGAERAGARHGSLGLGLSLVQRIARAHGGRAWAENRDGGGARVGFSARRDAAKSPTSV